MTLLLRDALREDEVARGVDGSIATEECGVGIVIGAKEWRRPTWARLHSRTVSLDASTMPPTTSPSFAQQRCIHAKSRAIWESAQYAVGDEGVVPPSDGTRRVANEWLDPGWLRRAKDDGDVLEVGELSPAVI
jgi:hypothetical protein